jgi:hypothetical protein
MLRVDFKDDALLDQASDDVSQLGSWDVDDAAHTGTPFIRNVIDHAMTSRNLIGAGIAVSLHDVLAFSPHHTEPCVIGQWVIDTEGAALEVQCLVIGVELLVDVNLAHVIVLLYQ